MVLVLVGSQSLALVLCARSSGHANLSHHTGDIAGVGGQQDSVGVLGQFGERADILLSHSQ